jgi:hypothetical protein
MMILIIMMMMILLHVRRTRRSCQHPFPSVHLLTILMELDGAVLAWNWLE